MSQYPIELTSLTKDDYGNPLVCSSCGHSDAGASFPGKPSGERPCFFCVRNVQREQWCKEHLSECNGTCTVDGKAVDCRHPAHGVWYDGSKAVKVPMDCYRPCDMLNQIQTWIAFPQLRSLAS